jgi:uncharacterized protein Yka (UPF0111/DUF47 family)
MANEYVTEFPSKLQADVVYVRLKDGAKREGPSSSETWMQNPTSEELRDKMRQSVVETAQRIIDLHRDLEILHEVLSEMLENSMTEGVDILGKRISAMEKEIDSLGALVLGKH